MAASATQPQACALPSLPQHHRHHHRHHHHHDQRQHQQQEQQQTQQQRQQPPRVSAAAWAVADGVSGELLYQHNAAAPLQIASITKVMTCYLVARVAEREPQLLEELVLVSPEAAAIGGTTADLRPGEVYTVLDLLYGCLLPSGNDAAAALAEYVGDMFDPPTGGRARDHPLTRFVAEMNREAARAGLVRTRFGNVHGLADSRQQSCAADVCRLTAMVMRSSELIRRIVAAPAYQCRVRCIPEKLSPFFVKPGTAAGAATWRSYPEVVTWTSTNALLGAVLRTHVLLPPLLTTTLPPGACLPVSPIVTVSDAATFSGCGGSGGGRAELAPSPIHRPSSELASASVLVRFHGDDRRSAADALPGAAGGDEGSDCARSDSGFFDRASAAGVGCSETQTIQLLEVAYVIEGVKTGITPAAGGCLATRLRRLPSSIHDAPSHGHSRRHSCHLLGPEYIIVTVLGSASKRARFTDTAAIASWALEQLHTPQQNCATSDSVCMRSAGVLSHGDAPHLRRAGRLGGS